MQLDKVQKKFKETMLSPAKDIYKADQAFLDLFQDYKSPTTERLKIYHNNVVGSLSEAICATFPLIEQLVGKEFLQAMARAFVFDHPPRVAFLHQYGLGFDSFIKTYEPAKSLPYLPDIARFELAQNNAYYAADDTALTGTEFGNIPPEDLATLNLNLRTSASLINSTFPILEIRDFCENEEIAAKPDLNTKHDCKLMIYRPHLEVMIVTLEDDEYSLLDKMNAAMPLGSAVEQTLDLFPEFNFTSFLEKHISLETFSSLSANKF